MCPFLKEYHQWYRGFPKVVCLLHYVYSEGNLPKLKDWEEGEELSVLSTFKKSLTFLKKVEKKY